MTELKDPFAVLGLPARSDLTDEDVRAAWRRIAAVTHPDLEDGGDPARFSAAAAAYDTLRTSFGRGEALADLEPGGRRAASRGFARRGAHRRTGRTARARPLAGARAARYLGLAYPGRGALLRLAVAVLAAIAVAVAGWTPATFALLAGAATWILASCSRPP
ncbi:MAG TPA: J domain-containing protein [Trebonia sp.]|nr:J domain-containing protein [Trebonia sp.]